MMGLGDAFLAIRKRLSGQDCDPQQNNDEESPVDSDEIQYPTIEKRTIAERLKRRQAKRETRGARAGTDKGIGAEPLPLYTKEKYGRGADEHYVAARAYLPKPQPDRKQEASTTESNKCLPESDYIQEPNVIKERPLRSPVYDQEAKDSPNAVMRPQDIGRFLREGFNDRLDEMICKVSLLRSQVAHVREDYYDAYQKADHALELAAKVDYKPLEGRCNYWLGMGAYGLKEYAQAESFFESAKICRGRYFEGETAADWQSEATRQAGRAPPGLWQTDSLDSDTGTSLADELGEEEAQTTSWASKPTGISKEVPRDVQGTRPPSRRRFSFELSDDEDITITTEDNSFRSPDSAMVDEYLDGDMISPTTTPETEAAHFRISDDRQDADTSSDVEEIAHSPEREHDDTVGLGLL